MNSANNTPFLQRTYIGFRNLVNKHADPNWFFTDTQEEILGAVIYAATLFCGMCVVYFL